MKDISDAADLIATARETLIGELLPTLAKEQRYIGLMIGNAMAIALRESRAGVDATHAEAARIRKLLEGSQSATRESKVAGEASEVSAFRRRLCAAIRDGQFDDAHAPALMAHLVQTASDWVAISNPKALRPERASA